MKWKPLIGKFYRERDRKLPVVCILGCGNLELVTPRWEDFEEERLDCRCYPSDSKLEKILVQDRPQVIITTGNSSSFLNLKKAPPHVRKRWIHYNALPDPAQMGIDAKTIRYIVSCPNHVRVWRKSFYESIGGHNKELHVADDYELMVRTFSTPE